MSIRLYLPIYVGYRIAAKVKEAKSVKEKRPERLNMIGLPESGDK